MAPVVLPADAEEWLDQIRLAAKDLEAALKHPNVPEELRNGWAFKLLTIRNQARAIAALKFKVPQRG